MLRLRFVILLSLVALTASTADLSGRYAGEWKSNGAGGGGAFRMNLETQAGGGWKCEFSFVFGGEEIKTTVRECKVDGAALESTYDFELQGNALRSKTRGQWDGKAFSGQYETTLAGGGDAVDDGSWTAALAH
jgi:hypothetical protein